MDCNSPGFPVHHQLLELAQTHVHWVSDAIQPSHPLSSPSPPAFRLSQHQDRFQWVSSLSQVAKVLEFQFQHQSWWIFRVNFLRIDWFDLPEVQGTLNSLLQHYNSKAPILQCSAFFMVQLSHPYMTTGKTIPLTIWTFVAKRCLIYCLGCHSFSSKEQASFNFMATVTMCSEAPWVTLNKSSSASYEGIRTFPSTMFRLCLPLHWLHFTKGWKCWLLSVLPCSPHDESYVFFSG